MGAKGLQQVATVGGALSPAGILGAVGVKGIFDSLSGVNKKDSIAAGNADAAQTELDKKALEARRRSFLGLQATSSPLGITSPIKTQRSTLGGY